MLMMVLMAMLHCSSLTAEMGVSPTASERPNMKETIRLYDGDERNSSWSLFDKMRRLGTWKERVEVSGGEGRDGVSGSGIRFSGP
ncbi:hypothetical protein RRF57_000370 [Xylaria bambusicola]|uniref:Uncharacterized protein n=1 Tax=Xylaria bambusicola TaxID=326684 RepID=A0AAN7U9Q9_9PEZI